MRKIFFPTTDRVHLARQKLLLEQLEGEAEVIVGVLDKKDKELVKKVQFLMKKHNPDIVLIRGDRFEMLPIAMTANYLGKTVAHIEGGDLSGSVDETVRHAITKLSHYHFTTNEPARKRVIQMGEHPSRVFNFGSLDCEFALNVQIKNLVANPYVLVLHHTIKGEENYFDMIMEALDGFDAIVLKSNNDFKLENGSVETSPEKFISLLRNAQFIIGNSSSGIKEASVLGTPAINVGKRQVNRLKPKNVINVEYPDQLILNDIVARTSRITERVFSYDYYQPNTAYHIAKVLVESPLISEKEFFEVKLNYD